MHDPNKTSEPLLAQALETIADGVLICGHERRYTFANAAAERILGLPRSEIVRRTYDDDAWRATKVDGSPVREDEVAITKTLRTGAVIYGTERVLTLADGRRLTLSINTAPVRDAAGAITAAVVSLTDVTERKNAEQALRQAHNELFETSLAGILITTPDGDILDCNPACLRMLGCASVADARARRSPGFYANPADRDAVLRRLREHGMLANHEVLVRQPGGAMVWLLQNILLRRDAAGRETIFSTLIDITERKRAEDTLRREREFIRLVLDTDPNLIFAKDATGRFVMANKALAELYGTKPEDLVGRLPGADLRAPAEMAEYRRVEEEVLRTGRSITVDEVSTRPNGRVYWFHTIKTPLQLPDGTTHVLGIATDVTLRKRAEDELRASREWFAAVFGASRDGIVAEADERIVYANEAAARLHGYDRPDEMIGRPSAHFLFAEDGPRMMEYGRRRLRGEPVPAVYQFRGLRKDGGIIDLEASVSCCRVAGKDLVITIVRDVADRMRLEEQLRQATKLEAVGRLAGGLAHDFNNLLTIILGYTDLLLNNQKIDEIGQRLLKEVNRAGERAARLTRQLLAFSRKQILQARVIDINSLVTDMDTMLRSLIGEDVKLVTELAGGLGQVRVDPNHLEQAIMNLAANARDAMPMGGTLTIQTRSVVLDDDFTAVHPEVRPGRYVLLTVCDTGCGMDSATLEHAFEPFFTTKPVGKGTGLGLASVFGTVKQSNGHIEVDSEPGQGSTFRIYLPCLTETAAPAGEVNVGRQDFPAGKETILLVEDEEAVRVLARYVLRACGYQVLEAQSTDDALRLAGQESPAAQLLLTDVVMPGASGKVLADELRRRSPALKVLFMSGHAAGVLDMHGIAHAGAFIHKPFTPTELARKVREVLDE